MNKYTVKEVNEKKVIIEVDPKETEVEVYVRYGSKANLMYCEKSPYGENSIGTVSTSYRASDFR